MGARAFAPSRLSLSLLFPARSINREKLSSLHPLSRARASIFKFLFVLSLSMIKHDNRCWARLGASRESARKDMTTRGDHNLFIDRAALSPSLSVQGQLTSRSLSPPPQPPCNTICARMRAATRRGCSTHCIVRARKKKTTLLRGALHRCSARARRVCSTTHPPFVIFPSASAAPEEERERERESSSVFSLSLSLPPGKNGRPRPRPVRCIMHESARTVFYANLCRLLS